MDAARDKALDGFHIDQKNVNAAVLHYIKGGKVVKPDGKGGAKGDKGKGAKGNTTDGNT